jgi:hypothetical protein
MFDCIATDLEKPADVLARFRGAPTAKEFVTILRHPEWWSEDFGSFHFGYCGRCAIGVLGFILGSDVEAMNDGKGPSPFAWTAQTLGLSRPATDRIFGAWIGEGSHRHVKPGDVADDLERYLTERRLASD